MTNIAMSQPPPGGPDQSTTQAVKEQAKTVGHQAAQAGSDVVGTASDQGKQVAAEAGRQARDLYGQARSQVSDQANAQQKRAVNGLYALGDEVSRMAEQGGQSGPATDLARQASGKINQAARWLEGREPGHLLDEVKSFARRKPGTFLAGAAALGVIAGRLSKNLMPDGRNNGDASGMGGRSASSPVGYAGPAAPTTPSGTTYAGTTASGYAGTTPLPEEPYTTAIDDRTSYGAGS